MKVLIVGDAHGWGGMAAAAHLAVDLTIEALSRQTHGIDAIIFCGDGRR